MSISRAMKWKHKDHEDLIVEPVRQYPPTEFDINIHVILAQNTIRVQYDMWRSRISQETSKSILAILLQAFQFVVSVRAGGMINEIDFLSIDDTQKTSTSFIHDPDSSRADGRPGRRMYKAGNLARYNSEGILNYIQRRDGQVKIRGNGVRGSENILVT